MTIKNKKEFSQEELKSFFYHKMTECEIKKIKSLTLDKEIAIIQKPTYQVKYIKGVGYMMIGEGYLILRDGSEPTHYFCKIFKTRYGIKRAIKKELKE
jgi:hypothetical protein